LGFYSIKTIPAETRTSARFLVVAVYQQEKISTGYQQMLVDALGIVGRARQPSGIRFQRRAEVTDCVRRREQSPTN
jgi:hypothetical protein